MFYNYAIGGSVAVRKLIFKAADGPLAHIVPLAARFRFTKNAADAKLVKYLAKHWRLSRAAAGTICAKGPSAALKIDFRGKAGRAS